MTQAQAQARQVKTNVDIRIKHKYKHKNTMQISHITFLHLHFFPYLSPRLCLFVSVFKFPTLFVKQYSLVPNNLAKLFIKINRDLRNFVQMLRRGGIWNECFNWPCLAN